MKVVFIADVKDVVFGSQFGATMFSRGLSKVLNQAAKASTEVCLDIPGMLVFKGGADRDSISFNTQIHYIQSDREDEILSKLETVIAGESVIHTVEGGIVDTLFTDERDT